MRNVEETHERQGRKNMSGRRRHVPLVALLAAAVALVPWLAGARAATPAITAMDPYSWHANGASPAMVAVMAGGEVKFSYPSGASHHYPVLHSGPEGATPNCTNLPTTFAAGAPGWSGSCTFSQVGTYVFYCGVHGALMTATITVANSGEPTATTEAATTVGETGATLQGTVNPGGHETSYHFRYGRTIGYEDPPTATQTLAASSTPQAVSAPLGGLAPATTYHFQLVAENTSGVVHGSDQTFTTASPPGPPIAITGAAGAVSETGATLKGTANPDGRPTEYFFEWGTSNAYGHLTAAVAVGEDHTDHLASAVLTSLSTGTVYHFRLVTRNTSSESVSGADQTFTTLSPPPPPPPAPTTIVSPPATTPPLIPPKTGEGVELGPSLVGASLRLTASRHGSSVRGSIEVGHAGSGGRLEVDLLAPGASLSKARHGSKSVAVGRIVRQSVSAGKLSFSVGLTARGKHALTRRRSLSVTVKVTLTPTHGQPTTVTRGVTLRL